MEPAWASQTPAQDAPAYNPDDNAPQLSTPMYIGRGAIVFLSMGLSGFLALVGVFGIQDATGVNANVDDIQPIFMGVYMIVFAATVFFYELIQLCPCEIVDNFYKRNFGFLYGPIGRGAYLIMIGVFAFGLANPRPYAISTAVLTSFWGAALIVLSILFPDLFPKTVKYTP